MEQDRLDHELALRLAKVRLFRLPVSSSSCVRNMQSSLVKSLYYTAFPLYFRPHAWLFSRRHDPIIQSKGLPPTYMNSWCDWLIKTMKDNKTEITFLKNKSYTVCSCFDSMIRYLLNASNKNLGMQHFKCLFKSFYSIFPL